MFRKLPRIPCARGEARNACCSKTSAREGGDEEGEGGREGEREEMF